MSDTPQPSVRQIDATLLIETGPQASARAPLATGLTRVGSDVDNEMVLVDEFMAPTHFTLHRAVDHIRLHATGGPVVMLDGTQINVGQSTACRDQAKFLAGGTQFRVIAAQLATITRSSRLSWRGFMPACLLAGGAFALAGFTSITLDAAVHLPAPGQAAAAPAHLAALVGAPIGAFHATAAHLAGVGLGGIALVALANGSVEARGEIMSQQADTWHSVQRWFDADFGSRVMLIDQVSVAAAVPPLAIQAVWPGAHSYVIDGSGQKLFVGAALHDGWTIESIDAVRVLLRRGQQMLAIGF